MSEPTANASSLLLDPTLDAALRDPDKRSQLNPMIIADALLKLQNGGVSDAAIIKEYLFSETNFRQFGKLSKLPSKVQEAIRQNQLNISQARALSQLLEGHAGLIPEAADRMMKEGMNQRAAEGYVKTLMRNLARPPAAVAASVSQPVPQPAVVSAPPQNGSGGNGSAVEDEEDEDSPAPAVKEIKTGDYRGGRKSSAPESGHLIRRSIVLPISFLFFKTGQKKFDALAQLIDDWLDILKLWLWNRMAWTLAITVVLALAADGLWHVNKDIQNWVARHWLPQGGLFSGPASSLAHTWGLPAPEVSMAGYAPGHKFRLLWNPVAPDMKYQVLWMPGYDGRRSDARFDTLDKPVSGPGAIVDVDTRSSWDPVGLAVRTVAPNGDESGPSNILTVRLTEDNVADTVNELNSTSSPPPADSGRGSIKKGPGDSPPGAAPKGVVPAPTNVHVLVESPDIIRITWRAVGPHASYNLYSSASAQMTAARKENENPIPSNLIEWIPETGLDTYWIVVTALDAQGHESDYSEAVQVIRHPQAPPSAMKRALQSVQDAIGQRLPAR